MKTCIKFWISLLLVAFLAPVLLSAHHPENNYGLPGDDFSLEGALELFKRSNSLEEFERELNSPDNDVNNLDLNYNGRIDYLRVVDHAEGNLHAIVIQALVGNNVSQDVAVIEVKRNYYGEAVVQIIGDEDLYGTAKIVEPYPYDDVVGPAYYDNYYDHYSPHVFVNVWLWPSVRFIFAPRYVVWVSPYYYDYYPGWYSFWRPRPWQVWHTRTIVYNHYYCVAPQYRIPEAHHFYGSRRMSAPQVHRHTEQYVQEHGGRSNFTYGKRNDAAAAPRNRNFDRSDKSNVATRPDRKREESPVTKPRTGNGNFDRSENPTVATRPDKKREESPVAKPRTGNGNFDRSDKSTMTTRPDKKREESPVTKPRTDNRRQETAPSKPSRGTSADSRPAPDKQPRQTTSSRETQPRTNSGVKSQNRSAKSSPQVQSRTDRSSQARPAPSAPKVNRTETKSRTNSDSGSNKSVKSESRQPRKGNG